MKPKFKLPDLSKLPKLPKLSKLKDLRLPEFPLDLRKLDSLDREHYKIAAYGFAAVIVLMIVAGLAAFLLSLRGEEQTMVPDVKGMELAPALVKLQEKELYPRIALRFTDNPVDRGKVVDQRPAAGAIVKAGRRINLSVSRGAVADRVENFVGQDLNEVKIHLQTLFASTRPLLTVREPPIYVFDKTPAGTILEQKPAPETELSSPVKLELVVSRGPEKAQIKVPDLMGLSIDEAVLQVEKADLAVKFSMRPAGNRERHGAVVAQSPVAGSLIQSISRVAVTLTAPTAEKGMVAGLFERDLPEYPYPLKVSLEAMNAAGERLPIMTVTHPGGPFSAPYVQKEGTVLALFVLDREVPPRIEVRPQ
jgi:eukaryotic-like serine/threonine-protein kinase